MNGTNKLEGKPGQDSLYEPNSVDTAYGANQAAMMMQRSAHTGAPSYAKNSASIKPSVSFMNLSREQTKINHFVDLQDGPSSLQKREGVATLREKSAAPLVYENER